MKTPYLHAFRAYKELIRSGELKSKAEGESICIDLQGNICGDILVFISPKNRIAEGQDIMDLVLTDTLLQKNTKVAFETFRIKVKGLALLPTSLVWLINIGFSAVFFTHYFELIHSSFVQNDFLSFIWRTSPVLILTAVTVFFGKYLGFNLFKPLFAIITRIIRIVRRIRKRKVS